MGLLFFFIVVLIGVVTAFRLLAPEMYLSIDRSKMRFPWERARLRTEDAQAVPVAPESIRANDFPIAIDTPVEMEEIQETQADKYLKLEGMLYEKSKELQQLTSQLKAERDHRADFEKVKDLMSEEILRLKNQIKDLKKTKVSHD